MEDHKSKAETDRSAPAYEKPEIREMSETEILTEFQVTQSMVGWWTTGAC